MASAPPLPKNVFCRSPGVISASFSASAPTDSTWYTYEQACTSLLAWAMAASRICWLWWPALVTLMPAKQSMYSVPSAS